MRIALMTDIHANREALEACLDHAAENGVARYVFLGDYAGYGADPGWVIDTVQAHVGRGAVAVLGNHDAAVLTDVADMNDAAAAAIAWTRTQLDARQRAFLADLPLAIEEKDRLYVHASGFEGVLDEVDEHLLDLSTIDSCVVRRKRLGDERRQAEPGHAFCAHRRRRETAATAAMAWG